MQSPIRIRLAIANDAPAIAELHFASVHHFAAGVYPSEVLDLWSPQADERRIKRMRDSIVSDAEIVVVAEVDESLVGFGTIVPASEELRALYIHPTFAGRGIGSALLAHLESLAREKGNRSPSLKASLNAVAFYQKGGFDVVRASTHRVSVDFEMACMEMRKSLS